MLVPYAQLTGYLPEDLIGTPQSPPEWAVWNVVDDFTNNNLPNVNGFELSPDGNYLLQSARLSWQDAGDGNWLPGGGDTGTYKTITDQGTGAQGLYQSKGDISTVINTTFNLVHEPDVYGGFTVKLYRPSPTSTLTPYGPTTYGLRLVLNWPDYAYEVGMPPLYALLVAAGAPISLQVSFDASTWITVDSMSGADSETFLDSCNRIVTFDVVPLFDLTWWQGLPLSYAGDASLGIYPSGRPPDCLQVAINGGASPPLVFKLDGGTFLSGSLQISGIGGNFGVYYASREYSSFATLSTPINQNQVPFYGSAQPSLLSYVPAYTSYQITPVYPENTIAQVAATLIVQSGDVDINPTTGNSYGTVALNMANLYYPPVFNGPYGGGPEWQFNFFAGTSATDGNYARISQWSSEEVFTQANFCRRSTLEVTLNNNDLSVTPASVPLANRVVTWSIGWYDTDTGLSDIEQYNFCGQISTDAERKGFKWELKDSIYSLDLKFSDLLNDSKPCGYFPAFDGQNMYFVMRQLGYKMGFTDSRMVFPYRGINDDTIGEYHLDAGSSYAPKWQPHPEESLLSFMLRVRDVCGAVDPSGAVDANGNPIIVPMVLYVDTGGRLHFEPWSIGWANNYTPFSTVQPVPAKTYTVGEQWVNGVPQLAALQELTTTVDLSTVRTNIQLVGRNPISGEYVSAGAVNNLLDGSSGSNPYAPGYLGYEMDLFLIDAQYTSQAAVEQNLGLIEQQVSVPVISTESAALLQPGLHALTGFFSNPFIGIENYGVTGSLLPVPFWVMSVRNSGQLVPNSDGSFSAHAFTSFTGRGVGQAGS